MKKSLLLMQKYLFMICIVCFAMTLLSIIILLHMDFFLDSLFADRLFFKNLSRFSRVFLYIYIGFVSITSVLLIFFKKRKKQLFFLIFSIVFGLATSVGFIVERAFRTSHYGGNYLYPISEFYISNEKKLSFHHTCIEVVEENLEMFEFELEECHKKSFLINREIENIISHREYLQLFPLATHTINLQNGVLYVSGKRENSYLGEFFINEDGEYNYAVGVRFNNDGFEELISILENII